jgi:hypothetical protein
MDFETVLGRDFGVQYSMIRRLTASLMTRPKLPSITLGIVPILLVELCGWVGTITKVLVAHKTAMALSRDLAILPELLRSATSKNRKRDSH